MSKIAQLEYEQRMSAEPKFEETYCSQCGQNLGPGDSGVSHCRDHMRLDQPRPSLLEAAQAVIDRWESPQWTHDAIHTGELIFALREALRDDALVCLSKTHQQLDEALGETDEGLWYEFVGRIGGTYGGRLVFTPEDKAAVWPLGGALYMRTGIPSKIGEQLGEVRKKIGEQLGEQELKLRNFELKANVTSKFLKWHAEVVKIAVLAEMEACAKVADDYAGNQQAWSCGLDSPEEYRMQAGHECADAIRARGQE